MTERFRLIVPVADIECAAAFFAALLRAPGRSISPGRQYFACGCVVGNPLCFIERGTEFRG